MFQELGGAQKGTLRGKMRARGKRILESVPLTFRWKGATEFLSGEQGDQCYS